MLSLDKPVFCLTVPKSGTHLLANVIRALIGPENVFPGLITEGDLLRQDLELEPKVYVGHVRYSPEVSLIIGDSPTILLRRDPRDVVVSYSDFLYNRSSTDPLNAFAQSNLISPNEALSMMIVGVQMMNTSYPDCMTLFNEYHLKWLPKSSLIVRYEDLLPSADNPERCIKTAKQILDVLGVELSDEEIGARVLEGSDPGKSATFHQGRIGRWREAFSPSHVIQFKAVAPNLVSLLGYEKDESWSLTESEILTDELAQTTVVPAVPISDKQHEAKTGEPIVAKQHVSKSTIAALKREFSRELQPIKSILTQFKGINDQVHQRISFLKYLDLGFFCWTDDWLHQYLNQAFWDHNIFLRFQADPRLHPDPEVARSDPWLLGEPVIPRVIEPILALGKTVHFLDVGCWYGIQSILISSALDHYGEAFKITAFDPGWGGKLAPFNFEINGHSRRIAFEPLAVTSHNRTSIVYGAYGHTENCRTVNRAINEETFSYPCHSTTVDSYLEREGIDWPIFMEIDIQGGEFYALQGAQRTLQEQCMGLILKFIPHALQPMIEPSEILSAIPGNYRLFNLVTGSRYEDNEIQRDCFAEFTSQLWRSTPDYTYLLILFERYYKELKS